MNKITINSNEVVLEITSTRYGVLFCIVDLEDYGIVASRGWHALLRGDIFHVQSNGRHKKYLHRVIMEAKAGEIIDHANRNGLDNRKKNLRRCSKRENAQNRRVTPGTFKGVSRTGSGKYGARIKIEGKEHWIGSFDTEIEAAKAYNDLALKHFVEFALLNVFDQDKTSGQN